MTKSMLFGAPGHRGVPFLFAWGMHTGISYQRKDFEQASRLEVQREAIDRFVKWGANFVELYPSNKEASVDHRCPEENDAVPLNRFREYSDREQKNQWTLDDFLAFNSHAHKHGFLVNWFIHCWWPGPHAYRAKVFWKLCREIGQDVSDILADGFGNHLDSFGTEGDYIVPEEANELLWPYHPGMSIREAAWGLNTTAANLIQTRGLHLTDGRDLLCDAEKGYMGLAPECWRHFDQFWLGEEIKRKHGKLYVGMQAESRDFKCSEGGRGWSGFGGMASADLLLEQINNYARAKACGWETSGTTAIWFINEALMTSRMKRYIGGMAQDPVRCAVAAEILMTGSDGRYPRVDYPNGTRFLQNNFFRLYIKKEGQTDIHWDCLGQGNYTNFVRKTSSCILNDIIESSFDQTEIIRLSECKNTEEAGARARIRHRIEYFADNTTMVEFRDWQSEADSPWLLFRLQRIFVGGKQSGKATTTLNFKGYQLFGVDETSNIPCDTALLFRSQESKPDILVYIPANPQIDRIQWGTCGKLSIVCKENPSHDISVGVLFDPPADLEQSKLDSLAKYYATPLICDMDNGLAGSVTVKGDIAADTVRTVKIVNPSQGAYCVCENGWWQMRGAQPSWDDRGSDLIKVVLLANQNTEIRPYGLLDGVVKSGWGCQYTQLLKDVDRDVDNAYVKVRVVDIVPNIWAPRIEFCQTIAMAIVNGKPWYYFDGTLLFLPNHRADFEVKVEFGKPKTPHIVCTFASVEETEWDGSTLTVLTSAPEWSDDIPEECPYYITIRNSGWSLQDIHGGSVIRTVPDFDSIRPAPMAGTEGVALLVPRSYNHPPLKGFIRAKGHTVRYRPEEKIKLKFRQEEKVSG